jgi:hypothetical protein
MMYFASSYNFSLCLSVSLSPTLKCSPQHFVLKYPQYIFSLFGNIKTNTMHIRNLQNVNSVISIIYNKYTVYSDAVKCVNTLLEM